MSGLRSLGSSALRVGEASANGPSDLPSVAPPPARDLAGALHEVSNALTVVLGWIDRARHANGDPEDLERALDVAAARAFQARAIVRRSIGAEVEDDPETAVRDVLADAVLGLEPEAQRAGLRFSTDVADSAARLSINDASLVLQILTNLLLNAIALSDSGERVRVDVRADGSGSVIFGVEDRGPGIPVERRATLFDSGISTRKGGAGIGLRYAAALAKSSGGALALVDSSAGARFELRWPTAAALTPAPRPSRMPPPPLARLPLQGTRILIVEDDAAVVDLLDTALTARGADVVSISHERDLEAALGSGPFDAALCDISPIQHDIEGALGALRSRCGTMRLVVISGSAESMPSLPASWVSAWVRKPFEISEILDVLVPTPRS